MTLTSPHPSAAATADPVPSPDPDRTGVPARSITVRRPGIDHGADLPKYFVAGDPVRSHVAAMLSAVFPEGEDFFVASVRAYRDEITDPELAAQVRGFIGQEAVHGREHRDFNERLAALGYPTRGLDRFVARGLAFQRRVLPRSHQLAVTAALEHYTATLAEALLRDEAAQAEFATDEVRSLFCWHALEETEHKAVAFDVFAHVSGSHRVRVATMWRVHVVFLATLGVATVVSLARDPRAWRRVPAGLSGLASHPFFTRATRERLADYHRCDFHPDDHDTVELLEDWKARYDAARAA